MNIEISNILTVTLTLFAVVDILGNIPLIISIRQKTGHINSLQATVVSFFIMMAFLLVGEKLLALIGIDVQSFSMAGAIVIFLLEQKQVNTNPSSGRLKSFREIGSLHISFLLSLH